MKTKREIALEIYNLMEDEDLVNFSARQTPDLVMGDMVEVIEIVLNNYLLISGQIIE